MQAFSTVANVFLTCWKTRPVTSAAVFLEGLAGITRCLSELVSWGQSVSLALPLQPNLPNVVIPELSEAYLRDYRVYRKVILDFIELWSGLPLSPVVAQDLWASWHHPCFHQVLQGVAAACYVSSEFGSGWLLSHRDDSCRFSLFPSLDAAAEPWVADFERTSISLFFFYCMGVIVIWERWSYWL